MLIKVKKILMKIQESHWIKACICALFSGIWFFIRESTKFTDNVIAVINIGGAIFLLVALYQILKEKHIPWIRIYLIAAFGFIANKYYDADVFYKEFSIELEKVCFVAVIIGIVILIMPTCVKLIGKFFSYLMDIVLYCIELGNEKKEKREKLASEKRERTQKAREKRADILKTTLKVNKKNDSTSYQSSIGLQNQSVEKKENKKEDIPQETVKEVVSKKQFIFWFVSISILSIVLVLILINDELSLELENVALIDIFNMLLPFVTVVICVMLVCMVSIGVLMKLVYSLIDIFNNRSEKNYYFVYASVFLLVSTYISKELGYTTDDVANTIAKGDVFSVPLVIIIILPVFFFFIDAVWQYVKKKGQIVDEICDLVYEIAKGIVMSLLKYIRFVTMDFLSSIAEIVEGDLNSDVGKDKSDIEENIRDDKTETENGEGFKSREE